MPSFVSDLQHFLSNLLKYSDFNPRNTCGSGWTDVLEFVHTYADLTTALCYFAIPLLMVYYLRSADRLPAKRLALNFVAFIVCCGTVHLIDSYMFTAPVYRLSALAKVVMAAVSLKTVYRLISDMPKLLDIHFADEIDELVNQRVQERLAELLNES